MKYTIGQPGGPSGPFYSVVSQTGEIIAMQIPNKKHAEHIAKTMEDISEPKTEFGNWINQLDERQTAEVKFAAMYAGLYHHGTDGHHRLMLIARMAHMLDEMVLALEGKS